MSPKIIYKKKEGILSVRFNNNKSIDSEIQGNVVIDYDKSGKVANIDLMKINLDNFVPLKQHSAFSIRNK